MKLVEFDSYGGKKISFNLDKILAVAHHTTDEDCSMLFMDSSAPEQGDEFMIRTPYDEVLEIIKGGEKDDTNV